MCRRALELAPEDPAVHLNLAVIAFRSGDLATARRCGERALRLEPTFAAARDLLARVEGNTQVASRP